MLQHDEGLGERIKHVADDLKHTAEDVVQDVIHDRMEKAREEAERGMFTAGKAAGRQAPPGLLGGCHAAWTRTHQATPHPWHCTLSACWDKTRRCHPAPVCQVCRAHGIKEAAEHMWQARGPPAHLAPLVLQYQEDDEEALLKSASSDVADPERQQELESLRSAVKEE
ncbi:hypothetical protein ABPG75_004482 [Micractinium tetrahymenae]